MKSLKTITFGIIAIVIMVGIFAFTIKDDRTIASERNYTIQQTWELPEILNEVSGIAWLQNGTIASVQDENGIIYIYDLKQSKIIEEIEFAGEGDYEGITIHQNDAYVLRSDGTIYEISNFRTSNRSIESFDTDFSAKNNMESLTFNSQTNSLIIAPKDRDKTDDFKGLYEIPLKSRSMNASPSIKINMNDEAFKGFKDKKIYKTFSPSDIAIHPITGDYYVLEGKNPKLIILKADGTVKTVHELDEKKFSQPEGLTFSPDGTLYISNEYGDAAANILKVKFKS